MSLSLSTPQMSRPWHLGLWSRDRNFMPSFCRKRQTRCSEFCRYELRAVVAFLSKYDVRSGVCRAAVSYYQPHRRWEPATLFESAYAPHVMPRQRGGMQVSKNSLLDLMETEQCVSSGCFAVNYSRWRRCPRRPARERSRSRACPAWDLPAAPPTWR